MNLKKSLLAVLFLFVAAGAAARSPAVEDFTGVEPESYSETAKGTEVRFAFGNMTKAYNPSSQGSFGELTPYLVLGGFLILPFAMWFAITRSNPERNIESENVANLADYQTGQPEESGTDQSSDSEEDFKKAG